MGISPSSFNQPNEIRELSGSLAEAWDLENEYPTILLRLGYGKPMPYSPRKSVEEVMLRE